MGYDTSTINVIVESAPYWIAKPSDVQVTEGEIVDFTCNTESRPSPSNINWFINGIPLQDPRVPFNPRRRVRKNRLIIQNVTKSDIAVYQCNVSNIHGYAFANFFVHVIGKFLSSCSAIADDDYFLFISE